MSFCAQEHGGAITSVHGAPLRGILYAPRTTLCRLPLQHGLGTHVPRNFEFPKVGDQVNIEASNRKHTLGRLCRDNDVRRGQSCTRGADNIHRCHAGSVAGDATACCDSDARR